MIDNRSNNMLSHHSALTVGDEIVACRMTSVSFLPNEIIPLVPSTLLVCEH